jgi:curved DNA-binding protein CbpA
LKDYYSILGVPPGANRDEIKRAYRRLAMAYHPDKNEGNATAVAYFHDIREAYETLTNPVKKDHYLQKRWYFQSRGKKFEQYKPLIPETVLNDCVQLNKYVHTLNTFRVDKQSLQSYVQSLLSTEAVEMLKNFNDAKTNTEIIELLLDVTSYLDIDQSRQLNERLKLLAANDQVTINKINEKNRMKSKETFYNRYQVLLLLAVTLIVCLIIWLSS